MTDKDVHQHPEPADEPQPDTPEEDEEFANNYGVAVAIGLPLGMVFGLLIFDNIALGLGIGLAFAPVIALLMKQSKEQGNSPEDASPE